MLDAIAEALGTIKHANTIPHRRFVPMSAASPIASAAVSVETMEAITRALCHMSIVGANQPIRLVPLAGGVSSDIYRAELPQGVVCVKRALPRLKVAAEWEVPVDRNRYEVEWLRVAGQIVPGAVPELLGEDRDGGAFAMTWLAPDRYPVWKSLLLDGRADAATAGQVGDVFGRIHAATAGRPDIEARFPTDALFHALRLDPYLATAARANPDLAGPLLELVRVTAQTKRVLVHGDASPKNILVGPEGPVVLDAECAWYGDPAFDLAFLLNHLVLKSALRPQSRDRYRAMSRSLVDAYRAHVRWEPWPSLEARTAALLPGLMLARVDGKSPVEYLVGHPAALSVRRFARERLLHPDSSLSALLDAFAT
jgi:aminoglycoside phosphotransferase (APT) family kinase protein